MAVSRERPHSMGVESTSQRSSHEELQGEARACMTAPTIATEQRRRLLYAGPLGR